MLQLHLSYQQFYCLLRCDLYWRFYGNSQPKCLDIGVCFAVVIWQLCKYFNQWRRSCAAIGYRIASSALCRCSGTKPAAIHFGKSYGTTLKWVLFIRHQYTDGKRNNTHNLWYCTTIANEWVLHLQVMFCRGMLMMKWFLTLYMPFTKPNISVIILGNVFSSQVAKTCISVDTRKLPLIKVNICDIQTK